MELELLNNQLAFWQKENGAKTNNEEQTTRINNENLYELSFENAIEFSNKQIHKNPDSFQLIYLDPPYNTKRTRGARKIYSDSNNNWQEEMSFLLKNCHTLLKSTGFLVLSINQTELFNLKNLSDKVFGSDCFIGLFPVKIRHTDRQLMINATYHDVFEYLLFYRKKPQTRFFTEHKVANVEKFIYTIVTKCTPQTEIINGKKIEIYQPNQYTVVKKEPSLSNFRRYIIAGKLATGNWSGEFFENHLRGLGDNLLIKVYDLEKNGLGYRWFETQNSKRKSGIYYQSSLTAGRPILPTNHLDYTEIVPQTYKEGGVGCDFKDSKKPEKLLEFILNTCSLPNDLVGDFFAGSGTTLATAIKLQRSCIVCENNISSFNIIEKRLENLAKGKDLDKIKYVFNIKINKQC